MSAVNLYESDALAVVTGHCLRPGGLDLTERALDRCRIPEGARVLDVGCGMGATVAHLRSRHGFRAVGLEGSAPLIRKGAAAGIDAPRMMARAERLPVASASLDAVICECVLSLCPDPGAVLSEIHRALVPGGFLMASDLFSIPQVAGSGRRQLSGTFRNCLEGAMDRQGLDHLVRAAGFELNTWEDHTRMLRELAARIVWEYGSVEALRLLVGKRVWGEAAPGCRGKYGYYAMTARKGGTPMERTG